MKASIWSEDHSSACRTWLYINNNRPSKPLEPLTFLHTMADLSRTLPLKRSSVQSARKGIKEHIHLTPVFTCITLSKLASTPQAPEALIGTTFEGQKTAHPRINLFFKCETFQRIGAFKIRGAFYALSRLSEEELARGVVTHSSGKTFPFQTEWLKLRAMLQATMHKRLRWRHRHMAYLRT